MRNSENNPPVPEHGGGAWNYLAQCVTACKLVHNEPGRLHTTLTAIVFELLRYVVSGVRFV